MQNNTPAMSVALVDSTAFVKIIGRASFGSGTSLKTLTSELRQQGIEHFVLDLSECVTMDSTFLGVLAGLALAGAEGKGAQPPASKLRLVNPNPRVLDLLESLGVGHLFAIIQQAKPKDLPFEPVAASGPAPTREEVSENCLEAHQLLMELNPENIPKFKEVTRFLAEDLRRIRQKM